MALSARLASYPAYAFLERHLALRHLLPDQLSYHKKDGILDPTLATLISSSESLSEGSTKQFVIEANLLLSPEPRLQDIKQYYLPLMEAPFYFYIGNVYLKIHLKAALQSHRLCELFLLKSLDQYLLLNYQDLKDCNLVDELEKSKTLKVGTFIEHCQKVLPRIAHEFRYLCIAKQAMVTKNYVASPLVPVLMNIRAEIYFKIEEPSYYYFQEIALTKGTEVPQLLKFQTLDLLIKQLLIETRTLTDQDNIFKLIEELNSKFISDYTNTTEVKDDSAELGQSSAARYLSDPRVRKVLVLILMKNRGQNKSKNRALWHSFFLYFQDTIKCPLSLLVEMIVSTPNEYSKAELAYDLLLFFPDIKVATLIKAVRNIPDSPGYQSLIETLIQIRKENQLKSNKKEIIDDHSCLICLDLPRSHIAVSCGHFVYCEGCIKLRETCILCNQPIKERVKVYYN